MDFFEFILFGFAQLPESVGLCLLPSTGGFQPLFLQALFFFSQDSDDVNVRSFVIIPQVPKALLNFFSFSSILLLSLSIERFFVLFFWLLYFSNLKFHFDSFKFLCQIILRSRSFQRLHLLVVFFHSF